MKILEGLFTINGMDMYTSFGVFLSEDNAGDMKNYEALLKPAPAKGQVAVDFREQDGEKYPDTLKISLQARDIDLQMTLEADDKADFLARYSGFIKFLKTGEGGWLTLALTDIGRSFRVFYKDCSRWSQLTGFEGKVYSTFTVRFREPVPEY